MKVVSFILGALASLTAAQQATLCKDYEYFSSNGYELNNNIWGRSSATSGQQCTYVDSVSQTGAKWHSNWQWQGGKDNVKSYVYSGRQISKKPVTQYSNLETEAYWVYDTQNIRCNVAYDLFTAANVNHDTSSGDYELMVWLGRYDVYPIGSSQGMVTVAGRTWELFYGLNGSMKVYSFVTPSGPIYNFKANMKDFFNYLQNNKGFPASSQNLITYQFGTEAFTGGPAKFTVNQWSANAY
ncbi:glycoside hydrolase family 12 protein [Stemphylium lycopersici]|uniref:Glycoside hydrolase family 12 protein n=1 Tax=Stemphylium lycopersici TaxID=183478 RepID=A0A364MZ21_STELY|nr:glycoside hydrolase family 12 protein [Stemphylium lycopersici]RAR07301.1 glycoside hydrolase family 12 protein [Stemphylium lycopersici]RAR07641.1 glycoside hydrolase family 12 protein [Stemphylium lycopersici]